MATGEVAFPGLGVGNLLPVVSTAQWQQMMGAIITDGIYDDGTFTSPGLVVGDSTGPWVKVNAYKASIAGFPYLNPTQLNVTITANAAAQARIDLIALSVDLTAQTAYTIAVPGSPGASPTAPTPLRGVGSVWQFPLGTVRVEAGALTVGNAIQTISSDKVTNTPTYASSKAACSVYSSGTLTIANGVGTRLTWDRHEFCSPAALHSTATNTDRFTVVTAGVYHATLSTRWQVGSFSGYAESRINANINGAPQILCTQGGPLNNNNASPEAAHNVTAEVALSAGDYLFASCLHDHAGTLTVTGGQYVGTRMSVRRLP